MRVNRFYFVFFQSFISLFFLTAASWGAATPFKEWNDLSNKNIGPNGKMALSMGEGDWRHIESEHFIYHFKKEKEFETVYIHAEVYYKWIKDLFGVEESVSEKRAHIYVFEDKTVWNEFCHRTKQGSPEAFTDGWELFIYRGQNWLKPRHSLAHEITHVILHYFVEGKVPLFLNEGFAEFVSYRAMAMQLGVSEYDMRVLRKVSSEDYIPLREIAEMKRYPSAIQTFYRESEWVVRTLVFKKEPQDFHRFLREMSAGKSFESALSDIYSLNVESLEQILAESAVDKKS